MAMLPVDMVSSFRLARFTLTLLAAIATASAADLEDHPDLKPQDVYEHDRGLVCGAELAIDDGLAFLYKGRRITLDALHLEEFLRNPAAYFTDLQPRGALFQESGGGRLGRGWLYLGVWMVLGLAGAAACTGVALRKGLSPVQWFAAGLAFNILAVIIVVTRPAREPVSLPPRLAKIPTTPAPYVCARCGGQNHPTSSRCGDCGADIEPTADSEVERAGLKSSSRSSRCRAGSRAICSLPRLVPAGARSCRRTSRAPSRGCSSSATWPALRSSSWRWSRVTT